MDNWIYVGVSYGLTWAVVLGYAVYLGRLTRRGSATLQQAQQVERLSGGLR